VLDTISRGTPSCVCVCACKCMCVCACACVCMHGSSVYVYIHIYIYICMHKCVHVYKYICDVYIYMCVCICIHMCVCVFMYMIAIQFSGHVSFEGWTVDMTGLSTRIKGYTTSKCICIILTKLVCMTGNISSGTRRLGSERLAIVRPRLSALTML